MPAAENFDRCIEFAEGIYTCIFHSDDVYLPTIVEKEVAFLESHRDVGAVFTYANVINENDVITSALLPNKNLKKQETYNFDELFPLIFTHILFSYFCSVITRTIVNYFNNDIFITLFQ